MDPERATTADPTPEKQFSICKETVNTDRERSPFPNIVITDLKMPRMNGFEFLEWIKNHSACAVIPTIVLSSSDEERDVIRAYQLGANVYFTKPNDFLHLVKLVRFNLDYWVEARIPQLQGGKCSE